MPWQKTFALPPGKKGMHLVTNAVVKECQEGLKDVKIGVFTLCCLHTSAALTVNENCDPYVYLGATYQITEDVIVLMLMSSDASRSVRTDMDMALDSIVPESLPWQHTDEGPDDSTSHTKASLLGNSITLPISNGKLVLGTWQGIYLAEGRRSGNGWGGRGEGRKVVATILP